VSGKKIRISLDISPAFNDRLVKLEELVEGGSKAAVIRQALQLLEFVARRQKEGARFKVVEADGTAKDVLFFGLPEVEP